MSDLSEKLLTAIRAVGLDWQDSTTIMNRFWDMEGAAGDHVTPVRIRSALKDLARQRLIEMTKDGRGYSWKLILHKGDIVMQDEKTGAAIVSGGPGNGFRAMRPGRPGGSMIGIAVVRKTFEQARADYDRWVSNEVEFYPNGRQSWPMASPEKVITTLTKVTSEVPQPGAWTALDEAMRGVVEAVNQIAEKSLAQAVSIESLAAGKTLLELFDLDNSLTDAVVKRVRYDTLVTVLGVLDGWIEGAKENHDALEHWDPKCCDTFRDEDIRRMVNDAARELGVTEPYQRTES
jgi:hypothetical protein